MPDRIPLPTGTRLELKENTIYEISGEPIGYGGSSILYNAIRILSDGTPSGIVYTLKECYPVSADGLFVRNENGEVIPADSSERSAHLLDIAKKNILNEEKITQDIYKTAMRMIPILEKSDEEQVTFPDGTSHTIHNAITVMESLAGKGRSIHDHLTEEGHLSAGISFQIIQQVLIALKEIHCAESPYVHLDIQDANIFLHGALGDESELVTLIDFGSAKPLHDGKTETLDIGTLFSTDGFTAPEILECKRNNLDHITLLPSADIFSVGCLLYLLLFGKKPEYTAIESNPDVPVSGKDLRRLKKDGFPPHLESKLQSTLSKALAFKPTDRYQSVDEMLLDVRIITEALARRRDPIEAMEYDAFICYKHGSLDTPAALQLQRNLESYRLSGWGSKKKHPFRNVFVDEGELASCPDMGDAIHTALKNSKYLIVICSPDTPDSIWVDKEIKEFEQLHGRDKILAVIISGDRDSSFPDRLKGNEDAVGEVLAANATGKNRRSILKNLGDDAFLKIAAAMLGVTYDSLKQRKKAYVFRNITMISVLAAILLSVFFIYALYQNHLIREQYLKTQISQARRMTDVSAELWKDGDKTGALVTALAVQSEDNPNEPLVPEQVYALNTALGSYKTGKRLSYNPAYTGAIQNVATACLSEDGRYLYVTDSNSNAYILSGDKGELLWKIDPDQIKQAVNLNDLGVVKETFAEITHIIPYSDDECIVTLSHCVALLNVSSKSVESVFAVEPSISTNYPILVAEGRIVIQSGRYLNDGIYIYDPVNGILIDRITPSTDDNTDPYRINDFALSSNGRFLAIGSGELIVYDIKNKQESILSSKEAEKVFFGDDNRLIAIFSDTPSDVEIMEGAFDWSNTSYTLAIFDSLTGRNLYMSSGKEYYGMEPGTSFLSLMHKNSDKSSAVAVWFGGDLYLVDSASASITFQYSFNDNIASVQALDADRIIVALKGGTVYSATIEKNVAILKILDLTDMDDCIYNTTSDELIVIRDGKMIICDNLPDPDMTFVKSGDIITDGWRINEIFYDYVSDTVYRFITYKSENSYHASGLAVFEAGTSEPIYVFTSKSKDRDIRNIGLGIKDDITYLTFIESGEDKKPILNKVNLHTGEAVLTADLSAYETLHFDLSDSVAYSADMTSLYVVHSLQSIVEFDISGDTAVLQEETVMEDISPRHQIYTDPQNRYLLVTGHGEVPYVYDTGTQEIRKITLADAFIEKEGSIQILMGKSSTYACFSKENTISIVDISKNEALCTFQTDTDIRTSNVGFFDKDKYLVLRDSNGVTIYETASGTMLSKQEGSHFSSTGNIVISDHSSPFFAIKDEFAGVSLESGMSTQPLYVFYVDSEHRIHPVADIDWGYFSPMGEEVLVTVSNGFFYGRLKDYHNLKESALLILDGVTLTDEQKEKYYLTD